jgi:hypothetical protein
VGLVSSKVRVEKLEELEWKNKVCLDALQLFKELFELKNS